MKLSYIIYTGILLLPAIACHQKSPSSPADPSSQAAPVSAPSADSTQKIFFPVVDFLQSEIGYLDSTPLAIKRYIIQNNRTDSSFINLPAFHQVAGEFISPELATGRFEKEYSEKSFIDQTTQTATFTYSTQNKALSVQRVDVLTSTGSARSEQVKSIYLEKFFSSGDTLITKKMLWKARQNLLIVTTRQLPGKTPDVQQVRVIWDTDRSE